MFQIKLKQLRESKKISQYKLASLLNISQSAIGNWEAGKREPNFETMQILADFFNVSVDYLLGRTNEKVEAELSEGIDPRFLNLLKENNISLESLNNLDDKKSQLIIDVIQNLIEKHK